MRIFCCIQHKKERSKLPVQVATMIAVEVRVSVHVRMSHMYLIIGGGTIGSQGTCVPTSFVLGASVHTLSKAFEKLLHIHVRSLW